jgi:hypothetical protein
MLTVTERGKSVMLDLIVRSGLTLALYATPKAPKAADQRGSYQEPVGGGYAPKKLNPKDWKTKNGIGVHPDVPFTFTGTTAPDVIYGYMVALGPVVLWHEPLPEPFPVAIKGDTLVITPTFALANAPVEQE